MRRQVISALLFADAEIIALNRAMGCKPSNECLAALEKEALKRYAQRSKFIRYILSKMNGVAQE